MDESNKQMNILIELYKPYIFIDQNELYNPIDINTYYETGTINTTTNSCVSSYTDKNITVNYYVTELDESIQLHYYFFYTNDAGLSVCCFNNIGNHICDIEEFVIELSKSTTNEYTQQNIIGLCYMPHGNTEKFWIRNKDDINSILLSDTLNPSNNLTHPKVYIMRGKHGNYPINKVYRYLILIDECQSNGQYISTYNLSEINKDVHNFDEHFGSVSGIKHRIKRPLNYPIIRLNQVHFFFGKYL